MRLSSLAAVALVAVVLAPVGLTGRPAKAATALEGVPRYSHIVVLTEENENEATTFGPSSQAPFLNSELPDGVFLPNYFGTGHVSLDNYLAMVSGQPGNGLSNSDCLTVSLWTCVQASSAFNGGTHLGDQLDGAGLSWRSYIDGASTPCFHGPYIAGDPSPDPYQGDTTQGPAYNVADRHVPFDYFSNVIGNDARCATRQRPISDLRADLAASTLPAFSFITPDTCDDGHDNPCAGQTTGGLKTMDAWLRTNLPPLVSYLQAHNGLLIINFDESNPASPQPNACSSCAGLGAGGQTGALLLGALPAGTAGTTVTTGYDHYSLLRTIEDSFGIANHLGLANAAQPMTAAFTPPSS